MVKQTIQIFARVKPTKSKAALYHIDEDGEGSPRLTFNIPRDIAEGFINNKKENFKFRFQKVFDQNAQQDEIFDNVAKPVIDNVLQGYNGTIFAYGQTGSGKTFTITGGAERYIDRGIIPRMLSYIFEYFEQNSERSFTAHISYLEIYNDNGYDLLDPKHEAAKLEDLPKVSLMEDSDQNIHLKNLSVHQAANEEEALNLLFLGDTNRMIAETPMNQASTRSHCIFTVHLTSREHGSATIRRSKLHLVDLAGSERVSKTGVNGLLLTEAKYINLSLHYLEQVITSLADKNRQHIPYRNSMMTSVLRDSLGGNCMTTMIATCAIDKRNIEESISTCRFAQRVAMIKNDVQLNEEMDPKLLIQKLKAEIQQLKEELAMATGEQRTDELTEEDLQRCEAAVKAYLADTDPEAIISVGGDMRKIHTCFSIMKKRVLERPASSPRKAPTPAPVIPDQPAPDIGPYSDTENSRLKQLVIQRDNEINILVNMLKKEKKRVKDASRQLEKLGQRPPSSARGEGYSESFSTTPDTKQNGHSSLSSTVGSRANTGNSDDWRRPPSGAGISQEKQRQRREHDAVVKKKILGDMSVGRQEAFELFRRDYEHNDSIEENKQVLKQRYAEAKTLGEKVNKVRHNINHLKSQIEHHRMAIAMKGLSESQTLEPDEEEVKLRHQMEAEKNSYKETFNRLRVLKTEIEHLQHLLEKAKVKLMKDFELWWAEQVALSQENQVPGSGSTGTVLNAWQTPPTTMSKGHSPSPASDLSVPSGGGKLGRVRGSVAGSIATQLRASNSADGRLHDDTPPQRSSVSNTSTRPTPSPQGIRLTGDPQADADIMAFVKARQNIIQQVQKR
ncbi:kinesin-like protein KIF6 isoform X2 [Dreissena polymorpha]|uniref:kinesin-like protein KIF6 isoform X2 n=1 Tax=Dreissena polymorpha TaxID=45954 RepID=UPI0022640204|nr:kinesin-like protein KIF6 isoform X2 [Dreissena polymorpha]